MFSAGAGGPGKNELISPGPTCLKFSDAGSAAADGEWEAGHARLLKLDHNAWPGSRHSKPAGQGLGATTLNTPLQVPHMQQATFSTHAFSK